MKRTNISFRTRASQIKVLDTLAASLDRDRSYVLNEALTAYVELYRWQMEHIKEGLRQADAGEFAPDEDIDRALKGHFR